MNYEKLKHNLLARDDIEALGDCFALCVDSGDHESNRVIRKKVHGLMRTGSSKALELYWKTHLFDAPERFDSFMLYLEHNRPTKEQFWLPRREKLMSLCNVLQDMEDGNMDELFLSMPPRVGKALANDTPILTRDGWKNHGDLVVGDEVIGMDGKFKKVIAVHPKCMLDRVVEITNGEKIVCHKNHEWMIYDRARGSEYIAETRKIENRVMEYGGERGTRGHRYVLQIPKREYVIGEHKDLPLDPYTFGVWLGDGTNKNPRICCAKKDKCVIDKIVRNGHQVRWSTVHKETGVLYFGFDIRKQLQEMGMCHSRKKTPKHIPDVYLTASIEQRLELLAGLIDTDGTKAGVNRYHFTTSEISLRDSFIELISTFGWRVSVQTVNPSTSTSGITARSPWYKIGFECDCYIPCEIERKRISGTGHQRRMAIKSIKRTTPTEGNCITVEGDGMYLAGKTMIPTHNTTLIVMFILWVMGRDSERSNLYCSFTNKPVDTFYNGLLEVLNDHVTYAYGDIFPTAKVAATNAKDTTIDLDRRKRYSSFTGRPIGGSLNGSCDCNGYMVGDDLCEGIEEALSKDRMMSLWTKVDNNLIPRAKMSCKRLWIGTRWSLIDPQGIRLDLLENEPKYAKVRWKYINTPALNEKDESNFDYLYGVGFDSDFYIQRRASFERNNDLASWLAQYQGTPIERAGAVFEPDDLRYYNGELPEGEPDRIFMAVDPAYGGGDFTAAPVVYQYGNDLYIADAVYDDGEKNITQALIVKAVKEHHIQAVKVEGTRMTASYGEEIDRMLRNDGIRVNMQINTKHFTGTGKRQRIFDKAPEIRERMIFLKSGNRSKAYQRFMDNLYAFTISGKEAKHDDACDACAMACDMAFKFSARVEVFTRPF